MDETKRLAQLLVELKYEDLNTKVIERVKDLVLDQIGVEMASSTKPWSVAVYKYVRSYGGLGESTILNYGDKVRPENAAFANATFGHGFELDDYYFPGNTHPGCVVIPSALALGEREVIDGKKFLTAVVTGYEAMGRVARSVAPSMHAERGVHSTGAAGTFGSAAVAGKILGFDPGLMLNAFGVAGSQSSGLLEFSRTGGNVKRIHSGMAAFGGMRSALLAQAGITGPPTVLEGSGGFCQAFSNDYHLKELTAGFGKRFVVAEIGTKPHCCCGQIHAPIDAAGKIVKEHGIKPDDIEKIIIGTNAHALDVVGTIREPEDVTASQFSASFGVAMCVVKGSNGFRDYTEENVRDPEIRQLARRVSLEVDAEAQAKFPAQRAMRLTVKLKDGRSYQEWLEGARGTPQNPMDRAQLREKFRDLAGMVLPDSRVNEIVQMAEDLDGLKSISRLCKLLVT